MYHPGGHIESGLNDVDVLVAVDMGQIDVRKLEAKGFVPGRGRESS